MLRRRRSQLTRDEKYTDIMFTFDSKIFLNRDSRNLNRKLDIPCNKIVSGQNGPTHIVWTSDSLLDLHYNLFKFMKCQFGIALKPKVINTRKKAPMKKQEFIADVDLMRVAASGDRSSIRIVVGKPYKADIDWRCPVAIEGLVNFVPDIHGLNSLQCLCLALKLISDLLRDCVKSGDHFMYINENGESQDDEFEFDSYFGRIH